MTSPRRLIDADDELERDLIRSAQGDRPSKRALERLLLGLGVEMATLPAARAAPLASAKASGTIGATLLVKWGAVGVAIGLATMSGAELVNRALEPPLSRATAAARSPAARAPHAVSRATSPLPASEAALQNDDEAPPPVTLEARSQVASSAPEPSASGPRASGPRAPGPSASGTSASQPVLRDTAPQQWAPGSAAANRAGAPSASIASLAEEMRILDTARRSLASGDARRALSTLANYERAFPMGALGPEASVLKVRALLAAGDRLSAEALAQQVIERAPRSEHAGAVRAALGLRTNP